MSFHFTFSRNLWYIKGGQTVFTQRSSSSEDSGHGDCAMLWGSLQEWLARLRGLGEEAEIIAMKNLGGGVPGSWTQPTK